jgi:hypothetical protein
LTFELGWQRQRTEAQPPKAASADVSTEQTALR